MEFRILGPLDVVEDGALLALAGHKQRVLLALLLLHRGEAISVDRLTDELWGEQPPATAAKSIQVYVSQLRKALGADLVETRGHGYALRVEPEQVDAVRFERLLERGRERLAAGEVRLAAQTFREGLALWRGAALADFAYEPFAQAEIARLEDLRLAADEQRVEADLALGRDAELVPELEALVRRHPLRERMRGQLMLALYRSGRQAEALDAYTDARRVLVDELGIEPSPALRELQSRILAQDPGLSGPRRAAALIRRRRQTGGRLVALGGVALLAAAAAVVVLTGGGDAPAVGAVRPLAASFCSPLLYKAGARPRFLIASDQELQGPLGAVGNQIAAAVEHVVRANGFKAGRYSVAYQACDDAMVPDGSAGTAKCSANARAYADNASVIGIVGPTLSVCAAVQLPIANRGESGPLPMVSPSNTSVGLTRAGLGAAPDEPARYYPSGIRNYVRIIPADDFQAAADAVLARRLGLANVFVLSHPLAGGVADAFRSAAAKLGVDIAGAAEWSDDASGAGYGELAREVRRSGADGVFLAGPITSDGDKLLGDLRAELGGRVRLLASDGFSVARLLKAAGRAAEGMTVSVSGIAPGALEGGGRRFVTRLEQALGETPEQFSVYAAQATQLLLDAIARSDGTRRSVVRELFASRVRNGILGDFDITESGDSTANQVTIYRVSGGRLRLDRIITPSLSLVVRR